MESGEIIKRGEETTEIVPDRWTLIRDALVFQLKLAVDGLRDFLLMPISLAAAVFDLLKVGPRPGRQFYDLLKIGAKTEYWINLFGAAEHGEALPVAARPGIDQLVNKMERLVVQEYERGGITSSAKDAVDRMLDGLGEQAKRTD